MSSDLARRMLVASADWLTRIGSPLDAPDHEVAARMLASLGLTNAAVEAVGDPLALGRMLERLEADTAWWNLEESLREELWQAASEKVGEDALYATLKRVEAAAQAIAERRARSAGAVLGRAAVEQGDSVAAVAASALVLSCHQCTLALLADADAGHYFALKHALFARGRWPLGMSRDRYAVF